MRRAIVFGASGQDGRILFDRLSKECTAVGLDLGSVAQHGVTGAMPVEPVDVAIAADVRRLVGQVAPDEIYYLAAHHHSSEERHDEAVEFRKSADVHLIGLVHVLEAIRELAPNCRVFYAGSSQMFGRPTSSKQDEATPFAPRNAYAITKVAGAHACALYRERYGIHASVGILYNHESPLRGPRFVTQRIAHGAWQAKRDPNRKLQIGSLSSVVDWGYAPDYVDAMVRIVSQPQPDDYIVASGEPHTVLEFVEVAFGLLGLDWRAHVQEAPELVGAPQAILVGDAAKLRARTGWRPSIGFDRLVEILVRAAE